ncbi:MAG: hypothetical protein ACI9DO_001438 [Reinekea sp.]|jgi:hypothetical protein
MVAVGKRNFSNLVILEQLDIDESMLRIKSDVHSIGAVKLITAWGIKTWTF